MKYLRSVARVYAVQLHRSEARCVRYLSWGEFFKFTSKWNEKKIRPKKSDRIPRDFLSTVVCAENDWRSPIFQKQKKFEAVNRHQRDIK